MATRIAFVGLGSNLGDRLEMLARAVSGLNVAGEVLAVSPVYETDPVGPDQPDFLNAVAVVRTELTADELLAVAQDLERAARRVRRERWGPRTLDADILLVFRVEADDLAVPPFTSEPGEREIIDRPDLVVPHPRMWERPFVLAPLHDVAPGLVQVPAQGWSGVRSTSHRLQPPSTVL